MSLLGMPEEIIILILNKLDTKAIIAVYDTCHHLRNIICMNNVIKECDFSLSILATAKSLTLPFFKDICAYLRILNVCGVQDMCKTTLLQALKKLKSLKRLNVAHTSITTKDLFDIHKVCPTIKSITVNLAFSKIREKTEIILPKSSISRYQKLFKNFENVHFVFDNSSLNNKLVFILLKEANLRSLTCTHTERRLTKSIPENQDVDLTKICDKMYLRFVDRKGKVLSQVVLPLMELKDKDYLIVRISFRYYWFSYDVHCSQSFKLFFSEHFGIDAQTDIEKTKREIRDPHNPVTKAAIHDVVMMVWNEALTEFSDEFFNTLFLKIQPLFPINLTPKPLKNEMKMFTKNWIFLVQHPLLISEKKKHNESDVPAFKKQRIAPPSEVLDCDEVCKDKKNITLTFYFKEHLSTPLTLSAGSNYLKEIIHLTLTGYVKYDVGFFNVLFRQCYKLETLDVQLFKPTVATSFISCLPLCSTLKNLRLVDDFINFTTLFATLCQCRTLENIHIDETAAMESFTLPDPKLIFVNCVNLYNFTICGPLYDNIRSKNLQMFNKVKTALGLHQLHIDLIQGNDFQNVQSYEYHLHLSIFNLVPSYHVTRHIFVPDV